jgi:WD40 repeat protein
MVLSHPGVVHALAFSPDGKQLSVECMRSAHIFDLGNTREIVTFVDEDTILYSATLFRGMQGPRCINSDVHLLVTGAGDGLIRVWNIQEGSLWKRLRGHTDSVLSIHVSYDSKTLNSGSADATIRVWDIGLGIETHLIPIEGIEPSSFAFSSDGKLAAAVSQKTMDVGIWDAGSS